MTWRTPGRTVGGLAALTAGLLWGVKSTSILLLGYQPPVVFEAGPALFGVTVASLASGRATAAARTAQVLGVVACIAGVAAVASELAAEVWGPVLAGAMASVVVGLIVIGVDTRRAPTPVDIAGKLALAIGLATIPAVLLGGLLAMINERLLEVPILLLACMWGWLGSVMLRADVLPVPETR